MSRAARGVYAAYIPYGAYWSSPFARWQGSLSPLHSLKFAAWLAQRELAARKIEPAGIDLGVLGTTVPQRGAFYGMPWVAALLGAPHIAGPTAAQACATSARCVAMAAQEVAAGTSDCALLITADRVSNGPQIYYPDPTAPGGAGEHEAWVLDNFASDPWADVSMVRTAENVAARFAVSLDEQHAVTLHRYRQYETARSDDSAFLKRFMSLPFEVPDSRFRKTIATLQGDEGIHQTTAEGLARLKPVLPDGTVTYGAQTHPADGSAGMLIASRATARRLSARADLEIEVVSVGQARADKAQMPYAPVPAARQALARAGLNFSDMRAIKTHNPFVINDIVLARESGFDVMSMNNYGSSLVWGHPQAPTGLRSIIELIEELEIGGGGYGLFTGCAAGDSAMAVIVHVGEAQG